VLVLLVLAGSVSGCGDDEGSASSPEEGGASTATAGAGAAIVGEIRVSAASSLSGAFDEIGAEFRAAYPGASVTFTFDSSSTLVTQILEGAEVDVFASAAESNMADLAAEDLIEGEPVVFARNELVIITKPGNPEGISGLADLEEAGVVSLCGEDVPCGRYATEALASAGVKIDEANVTRGQNATATATAVSEGDAVAGIVYVTDAEASRDAVDAVEIAADVNVTATYPIGVLADAGNAAVADAFVAYVMGDEGQAVLEERGFLAP
jgi:molybdate transport system substrate-binding protein